MQLREESANRRVPLEAFQPFDGRRPDNVRTTCNCCTEDLARLVKCEFRRGDPIGVTFIAQGVATIFVGTFLALEGTVLVVSNLFLDDTISFIPLCSVASVEAGCALANTAGSPLAISPTQ